MEKKQLVKMLYEIRNLAGEASLTGMFQKGSSTLVKHYNLYLKTAADKSFLKENSLFLELSEDANTDEIGIAASLLAAYLSSDVDEHQSSM